VDNLLLVAIGSLFAIAGALLVIVMASMSIGVAYVIGAFIFEDVRLQIQSHRRSKVWVLSKSIDETHSVLAAYSSGEQANGAASKALAEEPGWEYTVQDFDLNEGEKACS
jgi:hypothetical protein